MLCGLRAGMPHPGMMGGPPPPGGMYPPPPGHHGAWRGASSSHRISLSWRRDAYILSSMSEHTGIAMHTCRWTWWTSGLIHYVSAGHGQARCNISYVCWSVTEWCVIDGYGTEAMIDTAAENAAQMALHST
jgi:hypothetical protein